MMEWWNDGMMEYGVLRWGEGEDRGGIGFSFPSLGPVLVRMSPASRRCLASARDSQSTSSDRSQAETKLHQGLQNPRLATAPRSGTPRNPKRFHRPSQVRHSEIVGIREATSGSTPPQYCGELNRRTQWPAQPPSSARKASAEPLDRSGGTSPPRPATRATAGNPGSCFDDASLAAPSLPKCWNTGSWNAGMVEWWNGGIRECRNTGMLEYGTTGSSILHIMPPSHHSAFPSFHPSTLPPFHPSTLPSFHHSILPPFQPHP